MLLTLASPSASSSPFLPLPPHRHNHHHHNNHLINLPQPMQPASSCYQSSPEVHHQLPPPPFSNPHCHSRRRPKLSLQISVAAVSSQHNFSRFQSPPSATAAMSPTSRNTLANAAIRYTPCDDILTPSPSEDSCGSSSSSSCSEDEQAGSETHTSAFSLRDKKRCRRSDRARPKNLSTPMTTTHHPTTVGAGFLPRPQPTKRTKCPSQRRVVFADSPPEVFYRHIDDDQVPEKEVITTMERAIELGRLKQWVRQREEQSSDGKNSSKTSNDDKQWVRKLVKLEMEEIEREERLEQMEASSPL